MKDNRWIEDGGYIPVSAGNHVVSVAKMEKIGNVTVSRDWDGDIDGNCTIWYAVRRGWIPLWVPFVDKAAAMLVLCRSSMHNTRRS
jgi:hypothetical protein